MKRITGITCFIFFVTGIVCADAQVMLPDFAVKELTRGKIQVSWNNPYPNCIQLAIQRSVDSVKNFRTIFSSQSPELASNGYLDNKPVQGQTNYYRIFYVLKGGAYFFSQVKAVEQKPVPVITAPVGNVTKEKLPGKEPAVKSTPAITAKSNDLTAILVKKELLFSLTKEAYARFRDSINTKTKDKLHRVNEHVVEWLPVPRKIVKETVDLYIKDSLLVSVPRKNWPRFKDSVKTKTRDTLFAVTNDRVQLHPYVKPPVQYVYVYRNDSMVAMLEPMAYKKFKDSIAGKTKDTLFARDNFHIDIHVFVPKYVWRPSEYIFTNAKGYVVIKLPDIRQHRYHVIFYEEDGTELFKIRTLKEAELVLDKTDFVHAGWFYFELFEDDRLKEKNKFQLTKD